MSNRNCGAKCDGKTSCRDCVVWEEIIGVCENGEMVYRPARIEDLRWGLEVILGCEYIDTIKGIARRVLEKDNKRETDVDTNKKS